MAAILGGKESVGKPRRFELKNAAGLATVQVPLWRDGRVVEGTRLESVHTPKGYRGFESLSLRQFDFIQFLQTSRLKMGCALFAALQIYIEITC